MRALMLIAAAALAGSCARPATLPGAAPAQETAGRVAGPARTCVSSEQTQNLRVLDRQTLAYGWGSTVYVNHLPGPCPGLEPTSTLIVSAQSGQYCRGDRVQALEPGSTIAGPACNLGDWIPYRRP
jgi:hypothetical protein